jgi:DNA-binding transcriptional regulator/RsmH inhibitor MraZ
VIPANLRAYAGLNDNVIVAGSHNHLEVWDSETYQTLNAKIESDPQGLAQRINALGIL